jgi:serine protease inhibitor
VLYFKGQWAEALFQGNIRRWGFKFQDGRIRTVDMMTQLRRYPYLETDDLQAVALDYAGSGLGRDNLNGFSTVLR